MISIDFYLADFLLYDHLYLSSILVYVYVMLVILHRFELTFLFLGSIEQRLKPDLTSEKRNVNIISCLIWPLSINILLSRCTNKREKEDKFFFPKFLTKKDNRISLNNTFIKFPYRCTNILQMCWMIIFRRARTCHICTNRKWCVSFTCYRPGRMRHIWCTHYKWSMTSWTTARSSRCWYINWCSLRIRIATTTTCTWCSFSEI